MTQGLRTPIDSVAVSAPGHHGPSALGMRPLWRALLLCAALGACASKPPAPDWQMNAHGSSEKATQAYLTGNTRVAQQEWARARRELGSTGRLDLVARAELLRCAAQSASLALDQGCEEFETLRLDAAAPEQAYADYLAGRKLTAAQVAVLPPAQRAVAAALAGPNAAASASALAAVEDPLSRLVAAAALLKAGQAGPETARLAVDAASAQGWRRPLIAWLTLQAEWAKAAGDLPVADHARRRLGVIVP